MVAELKKGKTWISQKEIKEKERLKALESTQEAEKKRKQQELERMKVSDVLKVLLGNDHYRRN